MGFLSIDGHVRVYHGQHRLPKTHVARMRLPMYGTSDYWVNNAAGDPLFVVTAEANAGMAKMLPPVLTEVRSLVGSRRATVVRAPLIADAVANFECELVDVYRPGDCPLVIGKVLAVHENADATVRRLYTVGPGHTMGGIRTA